MVHSTDPGYYFIVKWDNRTDEWFGPFAAYDEAERASKQWDRNDCVVAVTAPSYMHNPKPFLSRQSGAAPKRVPFAIKSIIYEGKDQNGWHIYKIETTLGASWVCYGPAHIDAHGCTYAPSIGNAGGVDLPREVLGVIGHDLGKRHGVENWGYSPPDRY